MKLEFAFAWDLRVEYVVGLGELREIKRVCA